MLQISCTRPWLVASFATDHRIVGWSLNCPGFSVTRRVAWLEVGNEELVAVDDPVSWFADRLSEASLSDAAGMITARNVSTYERATAEVEGVTAQCLITLGLNNGETIGRRMTASAHPLNAGTINILAAVSVPLTDAALLEISSIATQARTAALLRFGYKRAGMHGVVTGTGTDCIIVAAPCGAKNVAYAGMHTAVGEAVGRVVYDATLVASEAWLLQRRLGGLDP